MKTPRSRRLQSRIYRLPNSNRSKNVRQWVHALLNFWTIGHVFWTDDTHKSQFYRIYLSGHQNFSIGEKMIVRTYRSKHFICTSVLLLSFTAACPSTGPMKKIDKKETYRKPGNTKPAGGQPPYQPA